MPPSWIVIGCLIGRGLSQPKGRRGGGGGGWGRQYFSLPPFPSFPHFSISRLLLLHIFPRSNPLQLRSPRWRLHAKMRATITRQHCRPLHQMFCYLVVLCPFLQKDRFFDKLRFRKPNRNSYGLCIYRKHCRNWKAFVSKDFLFQNVLIKRLYLA